MVQKEQKKPVSSEILPSNLTQAFYEVKQAIYTTLRIIQTELMELIRIIYHNLTLIWQRVILPFAITCVNILGYLLDKLLLGPPCFRAVLWGGAIFLPTLESFKSWVNSNQGWNIYHSLQGTADNVIGFVLGGGLGWVHYLSHLITSIVNISRPLINLLGDKGVFGSKFHYRDDRHEAVILGFGLISLPVVIPLIGITNGIITLLTFVKHLGLSLFYNINSTFNLLGERGIFGARHLYQDRRHRGLRIGFGLLSAPIVIPLALLLNGIDLLISGARKSLFNKQFLKKSLLILITLPIVVITALPAFMLRKTVKGLYNFTVRPLVSFLNEQPINKRSLLTGVANVISLGGYSALTKVFKAYTGYTCRFGYPNELHNSPLQPSEILAIRRRFKHAIDLAARGTLCISNEERTDTSQRPWLRLFYGFRSSYEKILKEYHDIFEQCVQEYQREKNPTESCTARFFKKIKPSPHYIYQEVLSYLDLNPGV